MIWKPIPQILRGDVIRFNQSYLKTDYCWNWIKSKFTERYGRFCLKGSSFLAHRVSYYLENNIDPKELLVCHTCNNEVCVNPKHLFLGTNSINQKQSYREGRHNQKGEQNPFNCLTKEQVLQIREIYARGNRGYIKIARDFNTTSSNIAHIVNRRTWSHI